MSIPTKQPRRPCAFVASGLPCPLSTPSSCCDPNPPHQSSPLLSLPGEIRNTIYRHALLTRTPLTLKLQFRPLDFALLLVSKQVFAEASGIFYAENVFRIPEGLMVGSGSGSVGGILGVGGGEDGCRGRGKEGLYGKGVEVFRRMKGLVVEVPIYEDELIRDEVNHNFQVLTWFIMHDMEAESKFPIKVQLRLSYNWGATSTQFVHYAYALNLAIVLGQRAMIEVDVALRTHPSLMSIWVESLDEWFGKQWSLEADIGRDGSIDSLQRGRHIMEFRDRYQTPKMKELYIETFLNDSYIFNPRRAPPSGA